MSRDTLWVTLALACMAALVAAQPKGGAFHYPAGDPRIAVVTSKDFREKVMDPTLPVVLQFYSPRIKACKAFANETLKAAELLQGYVTFAAVDGTTEDGKALGQMFGVQSYPTTMLFNPEMMPVDGGQEGQYMKMPLVFNSAVGANAASLVQFVFQAMAGADIALLDDLTDYKEFVDRHRLMELPKVILMTEQSFTSPAFKALSHEFRYGALFGVVHRASVAEAAVAAKGDDPAAATLRGELLAHLGLGGASAALPAIAVVTGVQDVPELLKDVAGKSLDELKTLVSKHVWQEQKRRESMAFFLQDAAAQRKKEAEDAKKTKALPVLTAYEASTWDEHCLKRKKGVCGAVFVENPDDENLQAWLQSATKQIAQRSSSVVQFVVLNALQNAPLASYFGATDMGFPTIAFINPGRKVYYNLVGSFSDRGAVNFFLDKVTKTKGKPYDPTKVPAFEKEHDAEETAEADAPASAAPIDEREIIVNEDL